MVMTIDIAHPLTSLCVLGGFIIIYTIGSMVGRVLTDRAIQRYRDRTTSNGR
jgi:hypothetical protein